MSNQLIICCECYRQELTALDLPARYEDVQVACFPTSCGMPPLEWGEIKKNLPDDSRYDQLHILSGGCIKGLPEENQKLFKHSNCQLNQCFHLIVSPELATYYMQKGCYLVTPGWLQQWRDIIKRWGFDQHTARIFFNDSVRSVLLLDTGTDENAQTNLEEFASYVNRPSEAITVGLDHLDLLLAKTILKCCLEENGENTKTLADDKNKELADFFIALDLLSSLARLRTEEEVIESTKEMFTMLFAPQEVSFISAEECVASQEQEDNGQSSDSFSVPVTGSSGLLGTIEIRKLKLPRHREQYKSLAARIVNVCGLALENARHYQQIKDLSEKDGLTGIANRRALEDHFENEWKRMKRAENPLTVLMCDIDYFKNYNDYYGHQAGDDCLKRVAPIFLENCRRPGDIAARYGGEEFTLVLPETDLQGGRRLAEKIRSAIEALAIEHMNSAVSDYVTVSIGLASTVPSDESKADELLALADRMLYAAKEAGRNRVVTADL